MTPKEIIPEVCRRMGVDMRRVYRDGRVYARQRAACVLALRLLTPLSYPEIRDLLPYRSHTSVISAERRAMKDETAQRIVDELIAELGSEAARAELESLPVAKVAGKRIVMVDVDSFVDRLRFRLAGKEPV